MPINQTVAIRGSVGARGVNNPADVRVVQQRLNELMPSGRAKLDVGGRVGMATLAAICEFQSLVCGFRRPDGRVDTNQTTIRLLNDPTSKQKWSGSSLATMSANVDKSLDGLLAWWQSRPKTVAATREQDPTRRRKLSQMKAELDSLTMVIRQKYPDGRPTGLGVLAVYTPGDVTIGGLNKMADTIKSVQRDHGDAAGCATALVSTVAVPFIVILGGAVDAIVTIGELAMEDPKHGNPEEYDRITGEVRKLRQKIESASQ